MTLTLFQGQRYVRIIHCKLIFRFLSTFSLNGARLLHTSKTSSTVFDWCAFKRHNTVATLRLNVGRLSVCSSCLRMCFWGVYIPFFHSHARWSSRRRFGFLLLCPLSVKRDWFGYSARAISSLCLLFLHRHCRPYFVSDDNNSHSIMICEWSSNQQLCLIMNIFQKTWDTQGERQSAVTITMTSLWHGQKLSQKRLIIPEEAHAVNLKQGYLK